MSSIPTNISSAAPSLSPYPSSSTTVTATPSQSPCIIDTLRCNVYYPFLLGDGFCDTPYNTEDCCWDKGDCNTPTPTSSPSPSVSIKPSSIPSIEPPSFLPSSEPDDKQTNQTFIYLPVTVGLLVSLVICMVIIILKRKARDLVANSQGESQSIQQIPLIGNESFDERDVRRQIILANIIHKKVVTKSSQSNDDKNDDSEESATTETSQDNSHEEEVGIVLPHEAAIRERSQHAASTNRELGDEEQGEAINHKKDDICIETLRSIRSEMNIHLDMESIHESSLYSPRSCPICCEDYVKGDDVAWSKNEDCCHAYHTDCIVPWLMDHDDCPMCRCVYVVTEEK